MRTLYVCQKCGEEVGEGEQDNGGCPYCGGRPLDPVGNCDDETDYTTEPGHFPPH